jgi:predicted nucleotidyltransferase
MTRLEAALRQLAGELHGAERRIALVGGLAVSVRAEPRLTRDVDLAVAVNDDDDAEALIRTLTAVGYRILAVVEQDGTKRLASARLAVPAESARGIVADLLFASSGIEAEIAADAEPIEVFADFVVPVAQVGHLVALKLLARDDRTRPQDAIDLRALAAVVTDVEIDRARRAIAAITSRGFARGRDLAALLEQWLGERR